MKSFWNQVCTAEEQEILQRDSNKSQKLRKKLMGGEFKINNQKNTDL